MSNEVAAALAVLTQGIRTELDGRRFYREAAERVADPRAQRMFLSIAEDEEEHLRILRVQYDSLSGGGGWVDLEEAKAREPTGASLQLFSQEKEAAERIIKPEMSDLDALKLGMEMEYQGYDMYTKASERGGLASQAVYRFLAGEESEHFAVLQKTHDYLAEKGSWFFWDLEKPLAEGPS